MGEADLSSFYGTAISSLYHDGSPLERQRSVMVIGVERGGTSMVAGVLRSLGIYMGERTGRNHENPDFQLEDQGILQKKIEVLNAEHDVWGFKYPHASLMVGFYNDQLRNPYYILVTRNIASVVDSWCSRGGKNDPVLTALHAIEYYSAALNEIKTSLRPAIMVNYEVACEHPKRFIETLAKFLGVELTQDRKLKSLQMITGEGGGYLNIPEHNFYICEVAKIPTVARSVYIENEDVSFIGKIGEIDGTVFGLACFKKDKLAFSRELYLDIKVDSNQIYDEFRFYTDFGGGFFSRHSYQLKLNHGLNKFKLIMGGNVVAICIACQDEYMIEKLQISIYC